MWHEHINPICNSPRWTLNMQPKPDGPHVWMCVGDDSGNGRVAIWGGSTLDDVDWSFGGWCVHELARGLELGGVVQRAIESRPTIPTGEWATRAQASGRSERASTLGDFTLLARSNRSLVRGHQSSLGDMSVVRRDGEQIVELWGWWLSLTRPSGGTAWAMHGWAAWPSPEVAMAHAECIAIALAAAGFGLTESIA